MCKLLFTTAVIVLIVSGVHVQAEPTAAIADLEAKVKTACEQRDLNAIKSCYDFDDVDPYCIDQSLGTWQEYWNEAGQTHWTFDKIEFASLTQLKADKSVFWENVRTMIEPRKMGEHTYGPNLEVIGFITAHFNDTKGSNIGTMEPVGIASNGTAKIASSHRIP